jgi:hypothetical protein
MFSCRSFKISFYIKVFDPLWINFYQGERQGSTFCLLHVASQFSQHHLLKRLFFLQCMFLASLSKVKWLCWLISGYSILFHWSLCLFLYQYHAVLLLWLCSITWTLVLCSFGSVLHLLFWGLLCFHVNFRTEFSISVKNDIGILVGMHWIYFFW